LAGAAACVCAIRFSSGNILTHKESGDFPAKRVAALQNLAE